jgi:hypothetical protein
MAKDRNFKVKPEKGWKYATVDEMLNYLIQYINK